MVSPRQVFLAALAVVLLLTSIGEAQTPGKVKIGWNYHMGNAPAVIADEKGLFKKHGVEVEVKAFASGPAVSQALATKELDVAYVGFAPAYHGLDRDVHVVAVAKSSYGLGSILVRRDSGINGLSELRGKKVAGSRKGSGNDAFLRGFILRELAKLEPDKDVQIVALSNDALGPALLERKVDAAMTLEPFTTQILLGEQTKALVHTVDAAPHHPWYLVVVRAEFLKQNRDAVVKVVKAHVDAVRLLNTTAPEHHELIAKAFKLGPVTAPSGKVTPPAEVVRLARERVGFEYAFGEKDMEFFERQIAWSRGLGFVKTTLKAAELFDTSVLRDANSGK